jgi:prepilin-type processing-associated H-X9-DG protein
MSYETALQVRPLSDATNTMVLKDSSQTLLAKYLKTHEILKCPTDKSYAIRNGVRYSRTRSYSMSQYLGESTRAPDSRVKYAFKPQDLDAMNPSESFVFLDEHEDSINDGFFVLGLRTEITFGWEDVPASRHNRGAHFVFADGHTERHRWADKRTIKPITRIWLHGVPQSNSPDVQWVHEHATIPK